MNKRVANIMITVFITLGIALLNIFLFSKSWLRLFETFTDFGSSISYYFCMIFGMETKTIPTVNNFSNILDWNGFLPDSSVKVKAYFDEFFRLFFSKENFTSWFNGVTDGLLVILKIIVLGFPCFILLLILFQKLKARHNNEYNKDTRPLRYFKWIMAKTVTPVIRFIKQYIAFIMSNDWIFTVWCIAVGIMLNLGSIIIAFFAYYFYFAVSFDVLNLWVQFSKLIIDLQVVIKTVPIWVWCIIGYIVFYCFRLKIARRKLQHFEARNCGFIKELPIVSMSCGSMGKRKTTLITDMALSQTIMFRQEAFTRLQKQDMKFPFFPWICLENELKACMEYGTIYNLASIHRFMQKKRKRYEKHGQAKLQLYGYDTERYGLYFNNALKQEYLFDVLETYAKLYFIYVIESSLLVANFSIREEIVLYDEGNFPMWSFNFFPKRPNYENSRFAHILDFDVLRLGKKVIENNPKAGSFEFGVIAITEVGKERANNLELKEIKKNAEETNQKNDLFNAWLKMCRHSATVDNFPFIKVFTDEQRPESWGADARDLADILTIVNSGTQRLALPFYTIEEMLCDWIFSYFISAYYDHRYRRGDNTLTVYILKAVVSKIWAYNERIYNRFGYSVLSIEKERGTQDGKPEKKRYFLSNYKIYRERFTTDCFSDYFNELALKSGVGLMDYLTYKTVRASVDELKAQNSYFINGLYGA